MSQQDTMKSIRRQLDKIFIANEKIKEKTIKIEFKLFSVLFSLFYLLNPQILYASDALCSSINAEYKSSFVFQGKEHVICKKYFDFCERSDSPICSETYIIYSRKCDIIEKSRFDYILSKND